MTYYSGFTGLGAKLWCELP